MKGIDLYNIAIAYLKDWSRWKVSMLSYNEFNIKILTGGGFCNEL